MVPGFVEEGWELSQGLSEFDNVDPNEFLNAIGPLDEGGFMRGATEGGVMDGATEGGMNVLAEDAVSPW